MQPVGLKIKRNVALLLSVSFLPCFLAYGITPQMPQKEETAVMAETDAKEVAETGADTEAAKRKAQLSGMFRALSDRGTDRERAAEDYRKIGFTYTEEMYLQLSGNDTVPEDWQEEMAPLMEGLIEEEAEFTEETGTDDGADEKAWEPVNALDAGRYAWATGSTEELPVALDAARAAQKRLGFPYSQPRRDSGIAYDCSSLVYWAYRDAGVNIDPVNCHTAASIAEYLEGTGRGVDAGDLKAGDLIFYSFKKNGRYKNISHVAMVCDGGLMVQASSTLGRVVMSEISLAKAVAIARPVSEAATEGQPDAQTATSSEAVQMEALTGTSAGEVAEVIEVQETTAEYGPGFPLPAEEANDAKAAESETQEYGPGFVTEEASETEAQAQPEVEPETQPSAESTGAQPDFS